MLTSSAHARVPTGAARVLATACDESTLAAPLCANFGSWVEGGVAGSSGGKPDPPSDPALQPAHALHTSYWRSAADFNPAGFAAAVFQGLHSPVGAA